MTDRQVALVTGASQGGTGTAIAIRLAAAGAKVAITARSVEGLEATRARIEEVGGECIVVPADLARGDGGRRELVARTEAELGPIDILVNNAFALGFGTLAPFDMTSAAGLEQCLQVHLWAPWELMMAVVPGMRERGRGWILNLTTVLAELPQGPRFSKLIPGSFQYGASKAALNRLTLAAAAECEGQGIAVNALAPVGLIATPQIVAVSPPQPGRIPGTTEATWVPPGAEESLSTVYEPLETMAEAALALCCGDPAVLSGRIAYSLELLLELKRPVYRLNGAELLPGWQPDDLPAILAHEEALLADQGLLIRS